MSRGTARRHRVGACLALLLLGVWLPARARAQEGLSPPPEVPPPAAPRAPPARLLPPAETGAFADEEVPEGLSWASNVFLFDQFLVGTLLTVAVAGGLGADSNLTGYLALGGGFLVSGATVAYVLHASKGHSVLALGLLAHVGALTLGLGINAYAHPDPLTSLLIPLVAMEVATLGVFGLTAGRSEVPLRTLGMTLAGGVLATAAALLSSTALTPAGRPPELRPALFMPLMGMGLGAVLAGQVRWSGTTALLLGAVPAGAALLGYGLGTSLAHSQQVGAWAGLASLAGGVALVLLPELLAPERAPGAEAEAGGAGPLHAWALPLLLPGARPSLPPALGGGVGGAF